MSEENTIVNETEQPKEEKKNAAYYAKKFGEFVAPIFFPVIPALVVGGLILAIRNLLINYFGVSMDSGTAKLMVGLFEAGFTFLPVYLGYATCLKLGLSPVLGMMLGALLISNTYSSGAITDFMGIAIAQVNYGSSIMPVIFGCIFMYFVDKGLDKVIPKILKFFLKPLLTMLIVAPVTLIALGPIGNILSGYVADGTLWLYDTVGFVAIPLLCAVYPYMVMLGLDKALSPIGIQLIATVGYNPITAVMGFVSNLCIGATTLAVASEQDDVTQKGAYNSFAVTALCGVTEPAFYGALISRPDALKGTACGAICGGLFAAIFGLRAFVQGGCPGLLTFIFFIDNNGSFYYVFIALATAAISIAASFAATKIIMKAKKVK
ncbi:MAG: PTS transporter subunit EIIC [Erysipelotrichaceae bacterium]|nr:PTS transporter subunit EIIC [Erysipelotrichaceae bacterium]